MGAEAAPRQGPAAFSAAASIDDGVSVVIPSRNEGAQLRAAIRSLAAGRSHPFALQIVVIDDASTDASCDDLEVLARQYPALEITLRRMPRWSGIPCCRNRGAELARHGVLVITDANTEYPAGWDVPIRDRLRSGRILAATIVDRATGACGYGLELDWPSLGARWRADPARHGGLSAVAACTCTIVERALFARLGGYDETLPLYGAAEPEFSVRAWLSGVQIDTLPELRVLHRFRPEAQRRRLQQDNREVLLENYVRFAAYYLDEDALRVVLSHYEPLLGRARTEVARVLADARVAARRAQLRDCLPHGFSWFADNFLQAPAADAHEAGAGAAPAAPRIAVYTAVLGAYDRPLPVEPDGVDYICFTDDPSLHIPGWRVRSLPALERPSEDARIRTARSIKLLPHRCLPGYDAWIWIDGNLSLKMPAAELARSALAEAEIAAFQYPPPKDCIYQEAQSCIDRCKDDPALIEAHMARYRARGFPEHAGLVETGLMARRNTPSVRAFNEAWWQELQEGSRRDQLSFNYVAWKLGMRYALLPGQIKRSPVVDWKAHRVDIYEPRRRARVARPASQMTLLLLNWKRPDNLRRVLETIRAQSIVPAVFLWNNGAAFSHPLVDWQINSDCNMGCWPRWTMGAMATTRYVCSLDDDFAFGDEHVVQDLQECLDAQARPDRLLGACGVILDPARSYGDCTHVHGDPGGDVAVDIVKGRMLACRTQALREVALLGAIREDDIALSALIAPDSLRHHLLPGVLGGRMVSLPEQGVGLSQQPAHAASRELARRRFFRC